MPQVPTRALYQLATLYGVQTAYDDAMRQRRQAMPDALLAVLQQLGAPLVSFHDVASALRERRQRLWQRCLEPVTVTWERRATTLKLRLPVELASHRISGCLRLETGEDYPYTIDLEPLPVLETAEVEGRTFVIKQVDLTTPLPWGYHRLTVELGCDQWDTLIITAPRKAFHDAQDSVAKRWGVFLPLYALHSDRSWGAGDFSDLETLSDWTAKQGGDIVATLPLLSAFLDEPCEPSPYAPASRLFWNELYIDITRVPELEQCREAQSQLASPAVQAEIAALRDASQIDYRRHMALKRRLLEMLVRDFFEHRPARTAAFQQFLEHHPTVTDYAQFRAVGERQGMSWPTWPEPLKNGVLTPVDYDALAYHYHLYVQWIAHEQLTSVVEHNNAAGVQLYLDLPLGAHPDSYDVWREREVFCLGVAAGAPPDTFFTKGQNWGFPPLHPDAIRTQGYRYFVSYLRHQLTHAGVLRIDHVMGLHRLFCIPRGFEARDGVYIRYAADELYAITNLESHRYQTRIVGENLGTVPAYVNTAMTRHQLQRMYVLQYALTPNRHEPLRPVPTPTVASLNTHDMPMFAAFWQGLDIADRQALDLLNAEEAEIEMQRRDILKTLLKQVLQDQGLLQGQSIDGHDVFAACLRYLAASQAQTVLVNVEDVWGEIQPQNVPGTVHERPNWRRKARLNFETFSAMPELIDLLREVDQLRRRSPAE